MITGGGDAGQLAAERTAKGGVTSAQEVGKAQGCLWG